MQNGELFYTLHEAHMLIERDRSHHSRASRCASSIWAEVNLSLLYNGFLIMCLVDDGAV